MPKSPSDVEQPIKKRSSLHQRVVTAVALAPVLLATIVWAPAAGLWALAAALAGVAVYEWGQFAQIESRVARWVLGLVVTLSVYFGLAQLASSAALSFGISGCLLWLIAAAWLANASWGQSQHLLKLLIGLTVAIVAAVCIGLLLTSGSETDYWHQGRFWFLFLLLIIWAADIGAYFSGKHFGQHKLAPVVSPNKTWEGVAGGMALVIALSTAAGLYWLDFRASDLLALIGLAMITAAVSIIGDLFISMQKRHADLKDAGRLFPGHGGVLDRFDSLLAAAPIFLTGKILLSL